MMNDQASEHFDVDVAIVGGGPVGLLLAAELLLGGVSVQVLERTTEASSTIKAGSINIASAEILARRGLLSRAREAHGRAVKRIAETMAGAFGMEPDQALAMATKKVVRAGHFAAIPLDNEKLDQTDADVLGHSEVIDATLVVQREVELLLEDHAASLGVTIRRGIAVTGLEQSAQGVIVHTDVGDISARYVVGCDGGRSVVRKAMGFDFPGTDAEITGHSHQRGCAREVHRSLSMSRARECEHKKRRSHHPNCVSDGSLCGLFEIHRSQWNEQPHRSSFRPEEVGNSDQFAPPLT
jgi:2-polyprenyl-6-methoxyphenol hydroxylase-like FAD-dependent oxidoreductase